ncbi:MAG: phosphatidylserine decarboxylase [Sandaracinus sp.]|nr:phosphatidylserine decarboxylase [Sandaracinus sp.]|tara:strand:+ start:2800 stop:3588 length:789 start_codon:yes stop_codon:yes gene_type:complete
MGRLAGLKAGPVARSAIDAFIKAYDVEMDDAVVPAGGYRTFNEFFTRRLVEGARPADPDPAAVLSPADGKVEDLGPIDHEASLLVKGKRYQVADLIGDPAAAERYRGGTFFIVYLSPRDYHRVHAPVSGSIARFNYVPGTLYPVNSIGLTHVPQLFAVNERVAIVQDSSTHGEVTTVMVGAIGVGRIGLSFDSVETNVGHEPGPRDYGGDGPPMDRAEELGVFYLGSTAIVFVGPESPLEIVIGEGEHVRVGQAIARKVSAP